MVIEVNHLAHTQTNTHTLFQTQPWPVTLLILSSEVTHLFSLIPRGAHLSAPA